MQRVVVSQPVILVTILLQLEDLHREIVLEMIDDSDGLHLFGNVHLEELYDKVEAKTEESQRQKLRETFEAAHDNW